MPQVSTMGGLVEPRPDVGARRARTGLTASLVVGREASRQTLQSPKFSPFKRVNPPAGARPYAPPAAARYHHVTRIAPRPTRTPIPTVGFSHPTRNFTAPCLWIRPFVDDSDFPASSKRYPPTNPPDQHPLSPFYVSNDVKHSHNGQALVSPRPSAIFDFLASWDFGGSFGGGGEGGEGGIWVGNRDFFRNEPTMP